MQFYKSKRTNLPAFLYFAFITYKKDHQEFFVRAKEQYGKSLRRPLVLNTIAQLYLRFKLAIIISKQFNFHFKLF